MAEFDDALRALETTYVVDYDRLKPGGRGQLEDALASWRQRGRVAKIVLLPRGTPLEPWRKLWDGLNLQPSQDLLLISNGPQWEARGWGLDAATIQAALDAARPDLKVYFAKGLVTAIHRLGRAADASATVDPSILWAGLSVVAAVGFAGFAGWVFKRRTTRRESQRLLAARVQDSAEQAYADLRLLLERLPADDAQTQNLSTQAEDLKKQLDTLVVQAQTHRVDPQDPVTQGRIRQLENEMAAVHSAVLQQLKES